MTKRQKNVVITKVSAVIWCDFWSNKAQLKRHTSEMENIHQRPEKEKRYGILKMQHTENRNISMIVLKNMRWRNKLAAKQAIFLVVIARIE